MASLDCMGCFCTPKPVMYTLQKSSKISRVHDGLLGVNTPSEIRKSQEIWVSHHELFMGKYLNKMRSGVAIASQYILRVNKKLHNSSDIAPLYNNTGSLFPSELDKANILNSYFESVFIKDDGYLPTFPSRLPITTPTTEINDIHISPAVLQSAMKKLKTNSAAGSDLLHHFYSKAHHSFNYPLTILFRNCIDLHDLPKNGNLQLSPQNSNLVPHHSHPTTAL